MRLLNHLYESRERLRTFVDANINGSGEGVFIQIFSGIVDEALLQRILDLLATRLPKAVVIGATTAGEIVGGKMIDEQIVLSFSLFEETQIETYHFPRSDYENGVRCAREVLNERTKACIFFSEGLHTDSESFLEGFTSVRNDVMIAGGNAADNLFFTKTLIFEGRTIHEEGVVVAVLQSDILKVHNAYSLNWTSVGKEMTITRAENNVVYEIDGIPVGELYAHYLGEETIRWIPSSAIEFPLIKIKDGVRIARSIIAQTPEGGFVYAGHFQNGDRVHFAVGNVEEIVRHASDVRDHVASRPAEAIYVYSCSVRKSFLQEQLEHELGLLDEVAPTAGFFTYGEYFHSHNDNQLLNITTTTLSLSEYGSVARHTQPQQTLPARHTMLKALTQLINVTQGELTESIKFLDQYKMVLDESSIVSKTNLEGTFTYVNESFCASSGFTSEELLGRRYSMVLHPDTPYDVHTRLWEAIRSGQVWKGMIKNLSKNGKEYHLQSVIVPIVNEEGAIVEYIAASVDVSELIRQERIIRRQLVDDLTGTLNRTALWNDLAAYTGKMMLIILNIDRFSDINSYFGYEIGDRLLQALGARLKETFGEETVYRISGDEFVLTQGCETLSDTQRRDIVQQVVSFENKKFSIDGYEIGIDLSCGVACAESSEVYKLAHIALKEAQEQRAKIIFFSDYVLLEEKMRNNIMFVDKIKSAIENDRIVPYFQGIVDNTTRKIVKYESLLRLIDRDGKVLTPYSFLDHAKKSKLYDKLTRIMFTKTFETFEKSDYEFSLNLTVQDLLCEETRTMMYAKLSGSDVAKRMAFEIVESEGIENFGEVAEFIRTVKGYGCKIAIDDFGTGYSNFSYLTKLDVDYIKIDGSLIKNITNDDEHLYTVESILHFAKKKGIKTIAEFVENEAIYHRIFELGIDYSQGYCFSIPSVSIETAG